MAFNAQRNDNDKAENGTWCEIMGGQFLVARAGNSRYLAAQERNGKRQANTAEERQDRLVKSIAEGILNDWRDVTDNKGDPIAYSVDAACEVLIDNPDLLSAILAEANDYERFRREDVANQSKKPGKPSSTS